MGTDHKEKLIRVLQILEETDEKSPMNATQILKYLESTVYKGLHRVGI